MKGKRFAGVFLCAGLMLLAGSAFGQGIFKDGGKALSFSPAESAISLALAQGATAEPKAEKAAPAKKEAKPVNADWGGFGGTGASYLPLDFGPLKPLTKDRGIDNFGPLWTIGGMGGAIYKNFRFGGYGFGVSQRTDGRVAGHTLKAVIDFGGGGLFGEYDTSFSRKLGLFFGTQLGAGGLSLSAKGADLGPEEKWSGDAGVFLAYPYLGVWLAPVEWMWVRLDGGYQYFHADLTGEEFRNDLDLKMTDGNLKGNYQIGLNICFGYMPQGK